MKKQATVCDICGKEGSVEKHVTRSFGKGDNIVVIEKIPMMTCPHCGESYFTAETLQEIERLRLHKENLKAQNMVPLFSYA